jgi:hypothetical protein
VKTNVDGEPE